MATCGRNAGVLDPPRGSGAVFSTWWLAAPVAFATIVAGTLDVPPTLPGTEPLDSPEREHAAMADRVMDGAHRFVDRKIREAIPLRILHQHLDWPQPATQYSALSRLKTYRNHEH
jgi:hypothetical protein